MARSTLVLFLIITYVCSCKGTVSIEETSISARAVYSASSNSYTFSAYLFSENAGCFTIANDAQAYFGTEQIEIGDNETQVDLGSTCGGPTLSGSAPFESVQNENAVVKLQDTDSTIVARLPRDGFTLRSLEIIEEKPTYSIGDTIQLDSSMATDSFVFESTNRGAGAYFVDVKYSDESTAAWDLTIDPDKLVTKIPSDAVPGTTTLGFKMSTDVAFDECTFVECKLVWIGDRTEKQIIIE